MAASFVAPAEQSSTCVTPGQSRANVRARGGQGMVRVAVVGLGWWGRIIVGLLKGSRKLTAVRGIDPDPRAAEFAREQGLPHATDFAAALQDPEVDAVVLCTPH